jgi:hypothetical protein
VNPDFKELLLIFNAHNVEYLIVGAHALAAHGHVRATLQDLADVEELEATQDRE